MRADAMAEYIRPYATPESPERIAVNALHRCGMQLAWRHYYAAEESRLLNSQTCKKHLLCPFCATRRASRLIGRYAERIALVRASDPSLTLLFVTLTVKDGPDLAERFAHLQRGFLAFRDRVRQDAVTEWSKVAGAVWSFEVKRGANSGDWHPHVHGLWLCRAEVDQGALAEQWRSITGDSFIVDVRPVTNDGGMFAETFKYALKFADLPLVDNFDAWKLLQGRRLIASSGCLHGVEVPPGCADELLDDPRYYDILFGLDRSGDRHKYRFAGYMR
jgi:Replication protein